MAAKYEKISDFYYIYRGLFYFFKFFLIVIFILDPEFEKIAFHESS